MEKTDTIDVVIPVHFEGKNIIPTLAALKSGVKHPIRVLICYDTDEDSTLAFLNHSTASGMEIVRVKNTGRGVHGAVITGFRYGNGRAAIMYPADDTANGDIIDTLIRELQKGADVVVPSRFMRGGCMVGCPWLKAILVRAAALTLHYVARIPVHDPTNGFRLFSRRVISEIEIESTEGFTYSLEYLVKAHRLGLKIVEVPAKWFERKAGKSRFRIFGWAKAYLTWYWYGYATTFLRKGPETVTVRKNLAAVRPDSSAQPVL
ncbi:MAG: glycosyltransferase family 2 protein [Deltaproteobacteria bacterium]|nr:glycosyltransferase family 2 protein [Deltaproteobacteria bacterium]MBI3296393.1 glycosyltransferase family 2 protein [Deltaproteobacteria bacterium]